ncbi:MAG TPA: tetratricopeptide repeat protein [Streptosporangiaceae bacterium]|nr:tetratricopeptide repeat protein [Streptosporangiaceae bacterium]
MAVAADDAPVNSITGGVHGSTLQVHNLHGNVMYGGSVQPRRRRRPANGQIVVGRIPQRPPAFQARPGLYDQLGRDAGVHVVVGVPGVGKTQLVAAYASARIEEGWQVVAWINAEDVDGIVAGFAELAYALDLGEERDRRADAELARRWMDETAERGLVVLDNAADPDVVASWLPATSRTQILITSTRRAFGNLGAVVDVDAFTDEEAGTYLRERTRLDDEVRAREIAGELGHLPLALAQSAALIRRQRLTYAKFLERFRAHPVEEYLTRTPGDPYPRAAARAITLAVEAVQRDNPAANRLLETISLLSPVGVDRDLLYDPSSGVPDAEIDEALGQLVDASLLTFGVDEDDEETAIVHRFVQRVILDRARVAGTLLTVAGDTARLLWAGIEARANTLMSVESLVRVVKHAGVLWALVMQEIPDGGSVVVQDVLRLRVGMVSQIEGIGLRREAIEVGEAVMADCKRFLEPNHPVLWTARHNLAGAYCKYGDADRACALFTKNLREQVQAYSANHPLTMQTRHYLAVAHVVAGRISRATRMLEEVLDDRTRLLGRDHVDTLLSRYELGTTYCLTARTTEGIGLLEQTLADLERTCGADHPYVLSNLTALAWFYARVGRLDDSLEMRKKHLTRNEQRYSTGYDLVLLERGRLADAYARAGRLAAAMRLYERNLAESEKGHGADSPLTLETRRQLDAARNHARRNRTH